MSLIEITYDKQCETKLNNTMSDLSLYGQKQNASLEPMENGDYIFKTNSFKAAEIFRYLMHGLESYEKEMYINYDGDIDALLDCFNDYISQDKTDIIKYQLKQILLDNKECWPLFAKEILTFYDPCSSRYINNIYQNDKDTLIQIICIGEEGYYEEKYLSLTQKTLFSSNNCIEYLISM